ncbi:MAG: anthranilate phosphoribosyltransferase [Chloroflexales bacterium]|nr:anthranilate phosphoribosyltransferase [Chloroflexales bacterium]
MSIRDSIIRLVGRHSLDEAESAAAMNEIMDGVATPAQIAAFLTAMHFKGETAAEIAGMARIMRDHALHVDVAPGAVDTCGTGGDGAGTFNISTIAAFVAAGAGVHIAKHGNRAMSSRCGSADVLEGLGVSIELDQIDVAKRIRTQRFGFMFAPRFHPAMRYAGPVRREIGIRTAFNLLGPLTNPAKVTRQVIGTANEALAEKLANALALLNMEYVIVFAGHGNIDELSLAGNNAYFVVRGSQPPRRYQIDAVDLGVRRATNDTLAGGDLEENVRIARMILDGNGTAAQNDVVVLNAAAAILVSELSDDWSTAITLARQSIESGAAARQLVMATS